MSDAPSADEQDGLDALARDLDAFFKEDPTPPPPNSACPPQLPDSDYRLVRLLGSGGMGAVWEAEQISLRRRVAVKILSVPTREFPAWCDRFVRESQIVAQLHHPNVVKVFAAGTSGETYWYAMELVEGVPLNRYTFPSLRAAVDGIREAAAALAYAHQCGVVHRDVKPANLLVDGRGHVLVADFGLAVSAADASGEGALDGTRRYMAPERLKSGTCGPAADQYALALVLREVLVGFKLGVYDREMRAVLKKALNEKPEARYADMDAFSDDLRRVLAYEPTLAKPVSYFHRGVLWNRRHPRAAVAAGVAVLCAGGFVAALCAAFARTEVARRQADRNARVADEALTHVFDHVANTPLAPGDAALLSALTPYYGELAGASGATEEKTASALKAQGVCAFRSNDYELAEQAFRQLVERRRRQASDLNWLAETLRRQGRKDEAETIARQVVADYSSSTDANDQQEVACALEVLGERQGRRNADRAGAFAIFHALWRAHPDNPHYRFRTLRVLAADPRLAEGTDLPQTARGIAVEMGALADEYLGDLDYGQASVELMSRLLKRGRVEQASDRPLLQRTCERGDALLGRFFTSESVITTVLEYRELYASWLLRQGFKDDARRERVRTETMIKLLVRFARLPVPKFDVHAFNGGTLPYLTLDNPGTRADAPASLVVLLHAKGGCGNDSMRPLTAPQLRPMVMFARRRQEGRTVFLLPQCPEERPEIWFGASRKQPDALFDALGDLVAKTAERLKIPVDRVFLVGEHEGADAALALAARRPELAGRVLVAGAHAVPREEAERIRAAVHVCQAEFDRGTRPEEMAQSLKAFGANARKPPVLTVLKGAFRTTVVNNACEDVFFNWLFDCKSNDKRKK